MALFIGRLLPTDPDQSGTGAELRPPRDSCGDRMRQVALSEAVLIVFFWYFKKHFRSMAALQCVLIG
jgi:hypothetical protein